MLMIFEGQDCVGKTTIATRIANAFHTEVQHYSKPDGDAYEYFSRALPDAPERLIVCDRHLLGEKIYAKVKKTPSQWKEGDYERMLEEINKIGAFIIIVWEYRELLQKRYVELGETFITPKEGMRVQGMFIKEAKRIAEKYPGIIVATYKPTSNLFKFISKMI